MQCTTLCRNKQRVDS